MKKHHPFSASQLAALSISPLYESDPSNVSAAAERGTRLHAVMESKSEELPAELSDEDAAQILYAREILAARRRDLAPDIEREEEFLQIDIRPLPDHPEWNTTCGGYADYFGINTTAKKAIILDYKFGAWAVPDAAENPQGWVYALGLFRAWPEVEEVTVIFVMAQRGMVSEAVFHRADIPRLQEAVERIVARALVARKEKLFEQCRPCVYTCPFCRHRAKCPSLWHVAREVAGKYLGVEIPEAELVHKMDDPAVAGKLLDASLLVGQWADSVRATLAQKAVDSEDGWCPEGYRLRKRANAELDPAKLEEYALRRGWPADLLAQAKRYVLQPILTWVGQQAPRGRKEIVKEELRQELLDKQILVEKEPVIFLERVR